MAKSAEHVMRDLREEANHHLGRACHTGDYMTVQIMLLVAAETIDRLAHALKYTANAPKEEKNDS